MHIRRPRMQSTGKHIILMIPEGFRNRCYRHCCDDISNIRNRTHISLGLKTYTRTEGNTLARMMIMADGTCPETYIAIPEPKLVISCGDCAIDGGNKGSYATKDGVINVVPVNCHIHGCPPSPETILKTLWRLMKGISGKTYYLISILFGSVFARIYLLFQSWHSRTPLFLSSTRAGQMRRNSPSPTHAPPMSCNYNALQSLCRLNLTLFMNVSLQLLILEFLICY